MNPELEALMKAYLALGEGVQKRAEHGARALCPA
jgi:hypothetical protein